jgi:cytochrome c oxidase subunit 2
LYGATQKLNDGSTVTADENYLRESILNPNAKIVAGYAPVMPSYQGQISEDQLNQLIAYIKSLADTGN